MLRRSLRRICPRAALRSKLSTGSSLRMGRAAGLEEYTRLFSTEASAINTIASASAEPEIDHSFVNIVHAEPSQDGAMVTVQLARGSEKYKLELHKDWIADNSVEHRDLQTNQKTLSILDVAESRRVENAGILDGMLRVKFSDGRLGSLPKEFLASMFVRTQSYTDNVYGKDNADVFNPLRTAIRGSEPLPTVGYERIMSSELGTYEWICKILDSGICIVEDAPTQSECVKEAAGRIAPPLNTLYGDTFDVRSEANPINIAYTNKALRPHMDLAYYESPPGLQFLHCMQFDDDVEGGESIFFDTFVLAEVLRKSDPEAFHILSKVPATFQKDHVERDSPAQMFYRRPHISTNASGKVISVFWSPAFEGPLHMDDHLAQALGFSNQLEAIDAYYTAYRSFARLMEDSDVINEWKIEFRSRPGTILAFNQRRMLHGRNAFSTNSNGIRWLQGCYVCIDAFLNRYRTLHLACGESDVAGTSGLGLLRGHETAIRVGNGCHR